MDFFGLDIGSHSIKLAQVKGGGKSRLVAFGSVPCPLRGLFSEAEADLTALAEAVKKLHQESKVDTKNVAVALPEDKVHTKVVTFPKLSEKELESAIRWEAEQYIPKPLSEVTLDYQVVGEIKEEGVEKVQIFLVGAPKKLIEKIIKVLKAAGLDPVALETEILALVRSLMIPDSEVSLLVDLGARVTDIAIVEGSQVIFSRSTPTAGQALTRAVASGLNLEAAQAEEYKKAYGADPQKLEGKIRGVVGPVLETVVKEIERAIQFYYSTKNQPIKRVLLAGGTAGLPEIVAFLAEKLNLEVQVGDPFIRLEKDPEILSRIPAGMVPTYATAIGLALKKID